MTITSVGTQAGGATVDSAAAATRAYGSNVTAGNLVWVAASKNDSADFIAGNATKSAGTATIGAIALDKNFRSTDMTIGIWSAIVTGTGSMTWSVAAAAGTYFAIASNELAATGGWDASRTEDTDTGSGTSLTQTTGDMTCAGTGAFVGGVTTDLSTDFATWAEDAAFTRIYRETNGSIHEPGLFMQRIVASGTTDAVSSTNSVEGNMVYVAAGVVYKEVASALTVTASSSPSGLSSMGGGKTRAGTPSGLSYMG